MTLLFEFPFSFRAFIVFSLFRTSTRALKYRTTSKREDEAVCLGPLLGLDPDQISAILGENSADARMKKLYILMSEIPAALLFNSTRKLK